MAVIRLLLVACLTTVLLAASLPIVESTRETTAHTAARDELDTLQTSITALTTGNDPVHRTNPGATRDVTITTPTRGPATTDVAWIAIGGLPNTDHADGPHTDVLAYHLSGGPTTVIHTSIDLRTVHAGTLQNDSTPLVITDHRRLTLTLITLDNTPTIRVQAVRF